MFGSAFYPHHEFNQLFHTSSPRYAYRHGPPHERRRALCGGRSQAYRQPLPFYTAQYYIVPEEKVPEEVDTKVDPKISLSQSEEAYGIEAEIPGFSREQITVEFTDSKTLRLHGSTAPIEVESTVTEPTSQDEEEPRTTTESTEHERSRSTSPKRTSIEEVRDETETDYIEVASEGRAQSPVFTESRTVSPVPQPQNSVVIETRPEAPRKESVYTKSFEKLIDLPRDINRDGVSAELKDGILRVQIARVRPDETRRRIVVA